MLLSWRRCDHPKKIDKRR